MRRMGVVTMAVLFAAGLAWAAEEAKPDEAGFVPLFNGTDLTGWVGPGVKGYQVQDGAMICPAKGGGNVYTEKEYGDFILRFEFKLAPGANNGVGIRAPLQGDAAYVGMEIQVLDDTAKQYEKLQPYQYHGSIYGVAACKRGHQKPIGEWNTEEIRAEGNKITIVLNGVAIVDADLTPIVEGKQDTADHGGTKRHPGLLRKSGHIGWLGHGSHVEFRNIRIKELKPAEPAGK